MRGPYEKTSVWCAGKVSLFAFDERQSMMETLLEGLLWRIRTFQRPRTRRRCPHDPAETPVSVYLALLSPGSRRSQRGALEAIAESSARRQIGIEEFHGTASARSTHCTQSGPGSAFQPGTPIGFWPPPSWFSVRPGSSDE